MNRDKIFIINFIIHVCVLLYIIYIIAHELVEGTNREPLVIDYFTSLAMVFILYVVYNITISMLIFNIDTYDELCGYIEDARSWFKPFVMIFLLQNVMAMYLYMEYKYKNGISIRKIFFKGKTENIDKNDDTIVYGWCERHNQYISGTSDNDLTLYCTMCNRSHHIDNNINDKNIKDYEYIIEHRMGD